MNEAKQRLKRKQTEIVISEFGVDIKWGKKINWKVEMLLKCKKQAQKKGYNRKRKYHGNQYTVSKDICNPEETTVDEVPPDVVGMKTRRVVTEAYKNSSVSSK